MKIKWKEWFKVRIVFQYIIDDAEELEQDLIQNKESDLTLYSDIVDYCGKIVIGISDSLDVNGW